MLTIGKIVMIAGRRYHFSAHSHGPLMGCRNFIFKRFTKEQRKSQKYCMQWQNSVQHFCTGEQLPPLNRKKMSMFDLHGKASKFNKGKGWILYQKIILTITMRRRLQVHSIFWLWTVQCWILSWLPWKQRCVVRWWQLHLILRMNCNHWKMIIMHLIDLCTTDRCFPKKTKSEHSSVTYEVSKILPFHPTNLLLCQTTLSRYWMFLASTGF